MKAKRKFLEHNAALAAWKAVNMREKKTGRFGWRKKYRTFEDFWQHYCEKNR